MIKRELKEVTKMRRKAKELADSVASAKKNGQLQQAKIHEIELNALKRSIQDYEDTNDPQSTQRKGQ